MPGFHRPAGSATRIRPGSGSGIRVIHDGIDTRFVKPRPDLKPLRLKVPADDACRIEAGEAALRPGDEIVTFLNRNLEPYRGYHIFMRALPEMLRRRPKARVVIVGGNEVSYGAKPEQGTWKQRFLDEVRGDLDLSRVHFVGKIPYPAFLDLMRLTTVHVYLTYPFVAQLEPAGGDGLRRGGGGQRYGAGA